MVTLFGWIWKKLFKEKVEFYNNQDEWECVQILHPSSQEYKKKKRHFQSPPSYLSLFSPSFPLPLPFSTVNSGTNTKMSKREYKKRMNKYCDIKKHQSDIVRHKRERAFTTTNRKRPLHFPISLPFRSMQ